MKQLLPLAALVLAAPAAAQSGALWPVAASGDSCSMAQTFRNPEFGQHTLQVAYDAARQQVTMVATGSAGVELNPADQIDLTIVFLDNGDEPYDNAWGPRRFAASTSDGSYRFSTAFSGEKNVRQILADLAASRSIGLMSRGKLVVAYELAGVRNSVASLRNCAMKAVAAN